MKNLFEAFNRGKLIIPDKTVDFEKIPWSRHSAFEGGRIKAHCYFRGNKW